MAGLFAQNLGMHGHSTPADDALAIGFDNALKVALYVFSFYDIRGQEDEAHGIFAGLGQIDIQLCAFLHEEIVRNLQQNAGAVTGVSIGALATTVVHIMQNNQCLL